MSLNLPFLSLTAYSFVPVLLLRVVRFLVATIKLPWSLPTDLIWRGQVPDSRASTHALMTSPRGTLAVVTHSRQGQRMLREQSWQRGPRRNVIYTSSIT